MAKIVVEEQKDYALLPPDSILALKVVEAVVREVPGRNGSWEKLEFTFEITGIQATGDGTPVQNYETAIGSKIWGSVPFRLTDSAENKLRLWGEAILGMEMGLGFELDTDYFVGRPVRGVTTQYDKKTVDPSTGRPFKGHQIGSLLPIGAITPAAQTPVQSPAPPVQQAVPAASGWGAQPEEPPF